MRRLLPAVAAVACAHDLPAEQPCTEVGFAIAARYEQCTGDTDGALALYEAFEADVTCLADTFPLRGPDGEPDPVAYECALVTRNLACELVEQYGQDLSLWLSSSPVCGALLEGP